MTELKPYGKCMFCKNKEYCENPVQCLENNYKLFAPLTNSDLIRTVTDYELAKFLKGMGACPNEEYSCLNSDNDCSICWYDWLISEVET